MPVHLFLEQNDLMVRARVRIQDTICTVLLSVALNIFLPDECFTTYATDEHRNT
jgi:hypothetical protein